MNTRLLSILTRTPLHVGAGSSVGAIDMPVQRERHTQIPIIPGSGLKGVLRDLWNEGDKGEQVELFGSDPGEELLKAGALLIGEARAVCFPVRSAKGSFAWLTCPLALRRYLRDKGSSAGAPIPAAVDDEQAKAGPAVLLDQNVVLEEYCFRAEPLNGGLAAILEDFLLGDSLLDSLSERLVLVSDGIYSHFCGTACEVQQRVRIDDKTHVVAQGALFNQENVPSETLFYAVVGERRANGALEKLERKLADSGGVLQIGGDETVGLGYCSVHLQKESKKEAL